MFIFSVILCRPFPVPRIERHCVAKQQMLRIVNKQRHLTVQGGGSVGGREKSSRSAFRFLLLNFSSLTKERKEKKKTLETVALIIIQLSNRTYFPPPFWRGGGGDTDAVVKDKRKPEGRRNQCRFQFFFYFFQTFCLNKRKREKEKKKKKEFKLKIQKSCCWDFTDVILSHNGMIYKRVRYTYIRRCVCIQTIPASFLGIRVYTMQSNSSPPPPP